MNGFDAINCTTDEEWEKYIDSLDDCLFLENTKITGDKLDIISLVNSVRSDVLKIIVNEDMDQDDCLRLSEYHEQLLFQAFCVEIFFNGPEHNEGSDLDSVKPIGVICNPDGSINLANDAYLEITGIKELSDGGGLDKYVNDQDNQNELNPDKKLTQDLIKQQKYLQIIKILSGQFIEVELPEYDDKGNLTGGFIKAKISKLFNEIYDEKNNFLILKNLKILKDGPGYKRNFEMKLTGKTYHWTTLNNKSCPWNIRTAVEYDPKSPIFRQRFDVKEFVFYPFGFYLNAYKYSQKVSEILAGGNFDENLINRLKANFVKLREFASIGDTLIDYSNFLVRGFDGKRHYFNREFFKNTPSNIVGNKGEKITLNDGGVITLDGGEVIKFTPQLLKQSLEDGTFLERVYGKIDGLNSQGSQIDDIKAHFKSLLKQNSYSYLFSPKNKIGGRNHIEYVTTRYDPHYIRSKEGKEFDLTTLGIFYHNGEFYQRIKVADKKQNDNDSQESEITIGDDEINSYVSSAIYDPKKDPLVVPYKLKTFGIGKYHSTEE